LDRIGREFRMPKGRKKGVIDERAEKVCFNRAGGVISGSASGVNSELNDKDKKDKKTNRGQ
jgi:hypothetical protein